MLSLSRRQVHNINSFVLLSFTHHRGVVVTPSTTKRSDIVVDGNKINKSRKKHLGLNEKARKEMRLHIPGVALICSDTEIASNEKKMSLRRSQKAVMALRLGSISGSFETVRRETLGEARVGFAELWTKGSKVGIMKWNPGSGSITADDALSVTIKSSNAVSVKGTSHFLVLDASAVSRIITWFETALKARPLWFPAILGPPPRREVPPKDTTTEQESEERQQQFPKSSSFKIEASFPSVLLMSRHNTRTTSLQLNDFFALIDISDHDVMYEASGRQAAITVLRHIVPIVSKRTRDVGSSAPNVVEWSLSRLPRFHTCIPFCPIRANGSILGTGVHRIVFPKLNLAVSAEHVTLLVDDVTQWIKYAAHRDQCRVLHNRPLEKSRAALEDYLGRSELYEIQPDTPVRSETFCVGSDFELSSSLRVGERVHELDLFAVLPEKQRKWHGFRWHHKLSVRVQHVRVLNSVFPITVDGVKISQVKCVLRRLDQMSGIFREATKVFELSSDSDTKISSESNLCSNIWQLLWTCDDIKTSESFKTNESLKGKISEHLASRIEIATSHDEACMPWLKFDIVVPEGTLSVRIFCVCV